MSVTMQSEESPNFNLTPSASPDGCSTDELSDSQSSSPQLTSFIGAENYITFREGCQAAFSTEELTEAITRCKKLVMETEECSSERKWLVRRLVELRHRLEQTKETENSKEDMKPAETQVKLGHNFKITYEPTSTKKKYCDYCCGVIWNVFQSYYRCSDCRYKCHEKCCESITRVCPLLVLSENPNYEMRICPEKGLDSQGYRCCECEAPIKYTFSKGYAGVGYPLSSTNTMVEARRCDYSGKYYCRSCHWLTPSVIPALVVHNWDFEPRPVSRAAYQLLKMSRTRPMITLDAKLYRLIDELATIKKMREELGRMKQYIATCRLSLENGFLMRELEWRRHLIHSSEVFSLNDLIDIKNGVLREKILDIRSTLRNHITVDCEVCKGRGFYCEFCNDKQMFFPFDDNIYICPDCSYAQHWHCWIAKKHCPRCLRKYKSLNQ